MQSNAKRKMELLNTITKLPEQEFHEVDKFVKRLLEKLQIEQPKPISLKGIWKDKGFERIPSLEKELKLVRAEMADAVLRKEI